MKKLFLCLSILFLSACQSVYDFQPHEYEDLVSDYNRYIELSKKYQNIGIKVYVPKKDNFLFNINNIIKNIKTTDVHIVKSYSFYIVKYEPDMGGSFVSSCYDYNGWYYDCGKPLIFIYGLTGADGTTIYEDLFLEYNDVLTYNRILEESFSKTNLQYNNTNNDIEKDSNFGEIEIEKKSAKISGTHSIYSFKLTKDVEDLKEFEFLKSKIDFKLINKLKEKCPSLPEKYRDFLNCENINQTEVKQDKKIEVDNNLPTKKYRTRY